MRTLSTTLITGLEEDAYLRFVDRCVIYASKLLQEDEKKIETKQVRAFVSVALNRAKNTLYLKEEKDFFDYIRLCILLGYEFEDEPFYAPLKEICSKKEEKTNTLDPEYALATAEVYLDSYPLQSVDVYKEHFTRLLDEYSYVYTQIKKMTYAEWVKIFVYYTGKESPLLDEALLKKRFETIHYEKVEKYGLHNVSSTMVYSVLSLYFGIGLDENPLYPKFQKALEDKETDETNKCIALIEIALGYLEG